MTDSNAVHIGRVTGSLRAIDDRLGAVQMEGLFDTDPADLWDAMTDPQRLARWIAEVEGDLRVGGVVQARFTSGWDGARTHRDLRPSASPDRADGSGHAG